MFVEKLKWAVRLLKSNTFVILLDKTAVVNIPIVDVNKFENQLLLAGQTAALQEFKVRLEELISEHEEAIALLAYRTSVQTKNVPKKKTTKRSTVGTKVRKTPRARKSK